MLVAVLLVLSLPFVFPTWWMATSSLKPMSEILRILEEFGWEAADMGTAPAARAIEPLCQLWCIPGFRQNMWTHAFAMLTR